jgi:CubicO group peptidase (beta-lactamase class C family)
MKQLLFVALLLVLNVQAAMGDPPSLAEQVDAIFSSVDNADTPGCAIGVIQDGVFVHKAGYGMANLELGVPLSADSVFRIASVTKQFTAMAVLLMADDGLIDLDEDIRTYLPDLMDYGTAVSIRAMLGQTSGIPDYVDYFRIGDDIEEGAKKYELRSVAGGPFRMGNEDYLSIGEFYNVIKQIPLSHAPLTTYDYSNTSYFLFSMLVEEVTGQSLRDYSKERIFDPLGMHDTLFHDNMVEIIKNRASGYKRNAEGEFVNDMTNLYAVGDGGLHTSINDFIKWDQNFYEPKLGKDPEAFIRLMTTPNTRIAVDGSVDASDQTKGRFYGNGQNIWHSDGRPVFSHSGSWLGFRTFYIRYPEQNLSVVTLCNDARQRPGRYSNEVIELYLEQ